MNQAPTNCVKLNKEVYAQNLDRYAAGSHRVGGA
jgi:hypothetical protein